MSESVSQSQGIEIPDALLANHGEIVDVIQFNQLCNGYRTGERAGFPAVMAERFCRAGVASLVHKNVPRVSKETRAAMTAGGAADAKRQSARGGAL